MAVSHKILLVCLSIKRALGLFTVVLQFNQSHVINSKNNPNHKGKIQSGCKASVPITIEAQESLKTIKTVAEPITWPAHLFYFRIVS